MNDKILQTIKDLLGIDASYQYFDNEIIPHLNGALFTLYQIGVTNSPFKIVSGSETWSNLLGDRSNVLELVKDYLFWKTKLAFDPPASGILMDAMKAEIAEAEWRLNVEIDNEVNE